MYDFFNNFTDNIGVHFYVLPDILNRIVSSTLCNHHLLQGNIQLLGGRSMSARRMPADMGSAGDSRAEVQKVP